MYYYYSEEIDATQVKTDSTADAPRRRAHQVVHVSNGFALLIFIISAIILHSFPQASQTWADILGVSLAVGACLQWLPQIVTTWRLGHLGSLSTASLCFLAPYTWIFGISMIVRVGISDWSAWIVYVLVGTMQLVLIVFAIIFSLRPPILQSEDANLRNDKIDLPLQPHVEMSQSSIILQVDERSSLLASTKPQIKHDTC